MRTNILKVVRDLKTYKGRTVLAFLAIMIGVMSVGFVLSAFAILQREMQTNFLNTNPASVVLYVKDLDAEGVNILRNEHPEMSIALRKTVQARVLREDGSFGTVYLFATDTFSDQVVDIFDLEAGIFPTGTNQIALERDSLKNLPQLSKGYDETLTIQLPGHEARTMELSGRVHAPGLPPASMEKYSYAFLSLDALSKLGGEDWYDEIRIFAYENRSDREAMRELSTQLRSALTEEGYSVVRVDVPEPGRHPHADQLDSLLFLLEAFAVISVLAAGIVMINLLLFLLSSQIRQIAVMKSLGASYIDILLPYILYVLVISLFSVLAAMPIAILFGRSYAAFAAGILNFDVTNDAIPHWVFLFQGAVGLLIPLLASIPGLLKYLRITVKEGLVASSPVDQPAFGSFWLPSLSRLSINNSLRMPLLNLSRNTKRTIPAILALATGGILFMTSQNIVSSVNTTVNQSMETFRYRYDVRLAEKEDPQAIKAAFRQIPQIQDIELYGVSQMFFTKQDGSGSSFYKIRTISPESRLVDFTRILNSDAAARPDAVYINNALRDDEPWIEVGMTVTMSANGRSGEVFIAGIVNEIPPMPCAYMAPDSFSAIYGEPAVQNVFVETGDLTNQEQFNVSAQIESVCAADRITIAENWNIFLLRKAFVEHLNVIVNFLSVVSILAITVGGISIASAVGMNISERRRELGTLLLTLLVRRDTVARSLPGCIHTFRVFPRGERRPVPSKRNALL